MAGDFSVIVNPYVQEQLKKEEEERGRLLTLKKGEEASK